MIDGISIEGLWNERNYRIKFENGSLIIVGENGSGKTTILRIIYMVLSRNWAQLYEEEFKQIVLESGNESFCIHFEDLAGIDDYLVNIRRDFQAEIPSIIINDIVEYCGEWSIPEKIMEACKILSFPDMYMSKVDRVLDRKRAIIPVRLKEANKWIEEKNEYRIIYMPTYRRSEKNQQNDYYGGRIKRHRGYDFWASDIEVAKVGMKDIDDIINHIISDIRNEYASSSFEVNSRFFKGILTREYEQVQPLSDEYLDPEKIVMIFDSISGLDVLGDNTEQIEKRLLQLLTKEGKYDDYDKIVAYFYQMLVDRYEYLEKVEEPLEAFFSACNKYLSNKKISYCPNEFRYEIVLEHGDKKKNRAIDLDHLSSGEKQLISLFSYIYLSNQNKCMVIIDEPELSLSVAWQGTILEDVMLSGRCGALIAATQSPFVFNNSLQPLAKSIDSFLTVE